MAGTTNNRRPAFGWAWIILPWALVFWAGIALQARAADDSNSEKAKTKAAERRKEYEAKRKDVMPLLRDPQPPSQDQLAQFDEFFNDYEFAKLTDTDCLLSNQAVTVRKNLRMHYFGTCNNPELYKRLTDLAFNATKSIVGNPKLPAAARYNAMLILGDLNEEDDVDGKKTTKPLKAVLPLLAFVVRSPKFDDYLKIAALIGIQRHAATKTIPPDQAAKLQMELLKLIRQQPEGRSASVHGWIQRCAAEILGEIGTPGPDNAVVVECGAAVANAKLPLCSRCAMAECLGRIKISSGGKLDVKALANELGYLAVDVCRTELETTRIKDVVAPKMRQVKVKSELLAVLNGLIGPDGRGGLAAAASAADQKNFIDTVAAKLKIALKAMDDEGVPKNSDSLVAELTAHAADFESVLIPRGSAQQTPPQQGAFVGAGGVTHAR